MASAARAAAALAAACLLMSCGGNSGPGGAGELRLTVDWPPPTKLIPAASRSIQAVLTRGSAQLGTRLLVRPTTPPWTTTVSFGDLVPGDVVLAATAYPNADGSGIAQATGSAPATVVAGQAASVTVTMNSTIATIEVTPASPTLQVGQTLALTATPKNAAGAVVLTLPGGIAWHSATTAAATLTSPGNPTTVTGVAAGTSLVTATEAESGKSGSTTVTVEAAQTLSVTQPTLSALDPSGQFFYVVSGGNSIAQFRVNPNGTLTPLSPAMVATGTGTFAIATTQSGGQPYAYVTQSDTNQVLQFRIASNGALVPLNPAAVPSPGDQPLGLCIDATGTYLYTADATHASGKAHVSQYRINAGGTLSTLAPDLVLGFQFHYIAITPDGKTVYTDNNVNGGGQGIQVYRAAQDGTLTHIGETGGSIFVQWFSIDAAGAHLYASLTGVGGNSAQVYQVAGDGSLTPIGASTPTANSFAGVVALDGMTYYSENTNNNLVYQFRTNADGSLAALAPPTVATDAWPVFITLKDSQYAYVSNRFGNSVSVYSIAADGRLTRVQ